MICIALKPSYSGVAISLVMFELHQFLILISNCAYICAGDYQHSEGMYQARVNLVPMASYPLPQQMSMYAPPPQAVGTGVFIPPAQYSRSSQGNQMPMQQQQQTQGAGQMQGAVHLGADGRGPAGCQWPVNGPSIVTGIPCYSNPPQPVYLQPGTIRPGMIAPGPNGNVYWTNNPGR